MATILPLDLLPSLANDLARVETALFTWTSSEYPYMTQIAQHLIRAGGKRVRPGFSLAAAAAVRGSAEPASEETILGAAAVELVHLGSLCHDDVMDDATTRRGVASVNAEWGNLKAILAGDFLLAKASEIAASLGTEVAGLLAATISELCEGQMLELRDTFDLERTEEDYLRSIDGKTASLLSTACRIGGLTVNADVATLDALTVFGRSYGMAFQIMDDVLDLVANDSTMGKPTGHDIAEGVYTLPLLQALAAHEGPLAHNEPAYSADELATTLLGLVTPHYVEQALNRARSYAATAVDSLVSLPSGAGHETLARATDYLTSQLD